MRPASIIMFERLFLAALALSLVTFLVGYEAIVEQLDSEPTLQRVGLGSGFLVGSFVVTMAIYLLLWFLIARKASNVAKWILVVLTGLGLISFLASFATGQAPFDVNTMLGAAYYVLNLAAVVHLFRADAVAWLKGEGHSDPTTFD